tara:strand:+ start:4316 stop:4528 length:213 start_codon:yes stop_codon:yes gene_type:complete
MFSIKENLDYLVGGSLLFTAPYFPIICQTQNIVWLENAESVMTLLIQVGSLILIGTRIRKNWKDNESAET